MDFIRAIFARLTSRMRNPAGRHDTDTSALWTSPWRWRDTEGLYIGHSGDAWLYRKLPINPLVWEDPGTRISVGTPLETILREIGGLSTDPTMGLTVLADERELHLMSVTWDAPGEPPVGTPAALAEFEQACLNFLLPRKVLVLGVRLKAGTTLASGGVSGLVGSMKSLSERALSENVPDRSQWDEDYARIDRILRRYGAGVCEREELAQLESWFNMGRGVDVGMQVTKDNIYVDDFDRIEMAVVREFTDLVSYAPDEQWALDATTHQNGPAVVSVRGNLQTAQAARSRVRRNLRRQRAQMEEEMATGDIERVEDTMSYQQTQQIESWLAVNQEPIITKCSIVMGRRVRDSEETYIDELRNRHGIEVAPLVYRQLEALDETLPCSAKRVNPFLQDVSLSELSYCGLQGWSNLGDARGLFIGLNDPDYTPCYLETLGAPKQNKPPAMAIFGEPGSGKTYLCQLIATQAVLEGNQVIFINPKGFDSLAPFAELVGGAVVKMSQLEAGGGYFDPFNYTEPEMAAEIAANFILGVLGNTGVGGGGFTGEQELRLSSGLKRGAASGARCVMDALGYVEDPEIRRMVQEQIISSTTFGLGIGTVARPRYQANKGLTLIEFDRKLDFPEKSKSVSGYSRSERISLAIMRLVTRASMEILVNSSGGVLIVDEAWTFLSHSEGLAALQQIGREGRSLNLLPIFATQRIADLVNEGIDMESYISRVMVMKLTEEREAIAALKLCGLEPTQARINYLKTANAQRPSDGNPGRPAVGLHRDLYGRHAAVWIGPVPPAVHEAFTTNPEERAERLTRLQAQAARDSGEANSPGLSAS
jgi:hypothetical protein